MKKTVLALLALILTFNAQASIIEVSFEGEIVSTVIENQPDVFDTTNHFDFGYRIGDSIVGSMFIDISKLTKDPRSNEYWLTNSDRSSDLLTSTIDTNILGDVIDTLSFQTDSSSRIINFLLKNSVYNTEGTTTTQFYNQIGASYRYSNQLFSDGVNVNQSFSWNDNGNHIAVGQLYYNQYDNDTNGIVAGSRTFGNVYFGITSLNYNVADVPAPGAFLLFIAGIFGLLFYPRHSKLN